jgi:ketosteroid isomerase-like protein
VPIASDVDCAGGGGNGPAYVRGPVRVIGTDIYDLDRDGDGIGCDSAPSSEAADLVQEYFDAINAGDYQRAWDLGGKNFGQSYESVVNGFADTDHDSVTIVDTHGSSVDIRLDAAQVDGSVKHYAGTYTVHDGEITDAHVVRR